MIPKTTRTSAGCGSAPCDRSCRLWCLRGSSLARLPFRCLTTRRTGRLRGRDRSRSTSTRPRPNASIRPQRPGMSSSSRWPMPLGSAGSTTRWSPSGSSPSIVRSSKQGRARRPGLRAARGRVLHRVLRHRPLVASERLRQPPVEDLGGIEDARRDLRGLLLEAVAPQAPGDERVVERPDRADVVADRVVASLALGQRPDAPAREEPRSEQVLPRPRWPWTCRRCRSRAGARCSTRARRPACPRCRGRERSTRRPITQKSRLKRRFRSAASFSSLSASAGSFHTRRASRAPRIFASYA